MLTPGTIIFLIILAAIVFGTIRAGNRKDKDPWD